MTDYVSQTVTYADGTKLTYGRIDNKVIVDVAPSALPNAAFQPIPFGYAPASSFYGNFLNVSGLSGGVIPDGAYAITVDTAGLSGSTGAAVAIVTNGPYLPFRITWLADPSQYPPHAPEKYTLNPQDEQDAITAHLRATYPNIPIIEDGLMDGEYEDIEYLADSTVKPFIVLWYSQIKRNPKGRSFANYKLDSHSATVDVVVVARNGTVAREILNDVGDTLVGFKTPGGGRLFKGASLWGDSRQVIDDKNRPSRWARTDRYDFGVQATKVAP